MKKQPSTTTEVFEAVLQQPPPPYVLRLYISGMSPRSTQAIARIKKICEQRLHNHYELEVIDIYQHPEMAKEAQIIAAPTLIRKKPLPIRRLIGNLDNEARVLRGLDLRAANSM